MDHALTRPEHFTLAGPEGRPVRGADQEWFRDVWQRRAGCGPTAAAVVLDYLSAVCPELSALAPKGERTAEDFLAYMEELWDYVTPGTRGLDKPESFALGCRSFALSRGAVLETRVLPVPRKGRRGRPDPDQVRTFLVWALDRDTPVAFLNWSNGDLTNLDSWHWVPLIACGGEGSALTAVILDGGEERTIDLALWLETSLLGGAFVRVYPDPAVYLRGETRDRSKEREP
jgi:hypothetical protein